MQESWDKFYNILMELIDTHVQKKVVVCNKSNRWDTPMDSHLRAIIKRKHRVWTRYMEKREKKTHSEFCRLRNKVKNLTRQNRKKFEKDLSKQAKSNPKAVWKYINSKSRIKEDVADLYFDRDDPNSKITCNDQEKAEVLSDFFSTVFTDEPVGVVPTLPERQCIHEMDVLTFTEEEVEKRLKDLNINKSPGPDNMNPYFLRELASELKKPLTALFNKSLSNGALPEVWKHGNITAIFKKGDRKDPGNYRPVSLTSIVCKLMESLIRDHIINFFKINHLFSDKQFGFLSGRSTSLQLLSVLDKWTQALEDGHVIDCVYMDYQKAFDKVPHQRLISKLSSYHINQVLIEWIKQFLTSRQQQVIVHGKRSQKKEVTSGIPQGSVLEPLLFVVYINDLPDVLKSEPYLFADDTKVFRIIKNDSDTEDLQDDLHNLQKWSSTWLLRFHPQTCKHMRICKKTEESNYRYKLNSYILEKVPYETDIGVTLDENLTFELHIANKVKKASSMFALIRRIFEFLDISMFVPLYKALVRVHLEYASSVWAPYKKKLIKNLENVQRRATKQLLGMKDKTYEERLRILNLPTL